MCDVIQKAVKEMINKTDNGVFPQAYPVFEAEEKHKEKILPDPLTEEERKEAKKMLSKLHRKTGHPSNHALSSTLKHRGAHYEVVEMAKHHQCPECQELRMAPLHPSVALQTTDTMWETVVMDNAEFPVDEKVIHCMIMVDEASRFAVPHFLFEHGKQDHRNATGPEVIQGLQESWLRHYGMPANVRMDPEGAFRSNELIAWGEERGVHFLPCAAESHGQIGIAERAIQTIKSSARQILQGADVSGWVAIQEACRAHNELAKVEGFSPFQWAFGRQPTLAGHMHEKGYDTPFLTSSAIPGSSMASNLRCRVEAQQAFLKHQAYDQISRAANSKTRRSTIFVPGDLVFFKRVKPPAQPVAAVRMPHRLWRWYGPGRVLATETRSDALGAERKPSNIVWIVTHGRLKRCSPDQLRHASERERLLAEGTDSPAASWTFHSLAQTLYKGEFEILDDNIFPGDAEAVGPPRESRRSRSLSRTPASSRKLEDRRSLSTTKKTKVEKTPKDVRTAADGEGARPKVSVERMTPQEHGTADGGVGARQGTTVETRKSQETKGPNTGSSSSVRRSPSQSGGGSQGLDLNRYLGDAMYSPEPAAVTSAGRPVSELFQQPLFKKARKEHLGEDEDMDLFVGFSEEQQADVASCLVCTLDLEIPEKQSEWRQMKRDCRSYFVKKVRSTEIKYHLLSPEEKLGFDKAKQTEVDSWLAAEAVKRVSGLVPKDRVIQMRWILTYKESGAPKGRIVLIGFQDPDLAQIQSSAPTMSRRTRQVALQMASVRCWRCLKADVKSAFLQGNPTEADRQLFARPVPELSRAMNLKDHEVVQVVKACYGLVSAPASWYECIRDTLASVGFLQAKSDPCLWTLPNSQGDGILGYICAHVDDFLIAGDESSEEWATALSKFHGRFKWSPWEFSQFSHCGIRIKEESDFSYTLDHSTFCEGIEQIKYEQRPDYEPVTSGELTQLRGALGALQWRVQQSGPHLAARLGQLQSEVAHATVDTIKKVNKLIRECFQTRHLSTRINQLQVSDPRQVVFLAWSDAALANRPDLSSTGGFLVAASNPDILKGERSPLSFVSWKSTKLQRKARSSLSAEAQALAEAEQELMFVRLAWAELCGIPIDMKCPTEAIKQIKGVLIVDAKSVYDILKKRTLNSAALGLRDKHVSLEILCLLEAVERLKTETRWVHSEAQLADGLTKVLPPGILHKVLAEGFWSLVHDPNFTSSKKLRAAKKTNFNQELRGVSVFDPNMPQEPES